MRTAIIIVSVIVLLVIAFAMRRPDISPSLAPTPSGGAVVTNEPIDWGMWASVLAGILAAIETALQTISRILAKRKAPPEAEDVETQPPDTTKPSG